MLRKAFMILGLLQSIWICSFSADPGKDILAIYRKADQLFNATVPTGATDSMALAGFNTVIIRLEKERLADTILFQSYLKKGILLDVVSNHQAAKHAYLNALAVHQQHSDWSDSLAFTVSLFAGSVYYHLNQFDSANHFLAMAERLSKRFPGVPEKERLYNVWGALFYESGNYRQSCNFFSQALEIVRSKKPFDKVSAINFEQNIAASYYKQEQYERSLSIYNRLLKQGLFTNQIWLNMGKSHLAMGNYQTALEYFSKVRHTEVPGVDNEIAKAYLLQDRAEAAAAALQCFANHLLRDQRNRSSADAGVYFLYKAELQARLKEFTAAIASLQQAIIIFSGRFSDTDSYSNPSGFAGSFASLKLFEALRSKATVFEQLYRSNPQEIFLRASLAAYQSAISLLQYIEKSYNTDEARLLLNKNYKQVYDGAFAVCMQLYHVHGDEQFLEQAFLIAEKSKASVISQQLREHQFKQTRGIAPALLQEEGQLKYLIARLNIRIDQGKDPKEMEKIMKEKMGLEISLSKLQHEIEQNNSYYKLKYEENYPGPRQIRTMIHPDQALISLYSGGNRLYAFVIARNSFRYVQIDSFNLVKELIRHWTEAMQQAVPGRRFSQTATGQELFRRLVLPVRSLTDGRKEWIIIPDDVLHFLPFESLPDSNGVPLLESTTISYHFSSQFVVQPPAKRNHQAYMVLSFAPFNNNGMRMPDNSLLPALPASINEIAGLPGQQFTNEAATKWHFQENLNRYPILHLVTHAVADKGNSGRSFLAFYPHPGTEAGNRLYVEELYGLNMDSTELVILSACETGNGQLVNGEGVMSLSRGFAYAGCASIINSLWKADDRASSLILKKFHQYLQAGYSKARALQLAKLDYIKTDDLHRSPAYWANLVLIGNSDAWETDNSVPARWLIFAGIMLALIPYYRSFPVLYSRIFRSRPGHSRILPE